MENLFIQELFETVQAILSDKLGVELHEITMESHIMNDLGVDSLDAVEIVMELEKLYDITITDDEAENLLTVRDIVDLLKDKNMSKNLKDDEFINKIFKHYAKGGQEKSVEFKPDHSNDKWLEPIEVQVQMVNHRKKFVTEIRRFELKENWNENDIIADIQKKEQDDFVLYYNWAIGLKGDIFEELIDVPNTFVNVTKLKRENKQFNNTITRMYLSNYLYTLNADMTDYRQDNHYKSNPTVLEVRLQNTLRLKKTYDNLMPINSIQPKDSELLNDLNYNLNNLRNSYKRKIKKIAQLNEDITDLEGIFGIENNI